jgi:hypothetical protein
MKNALSLLLLALMSISAHAQVIKGNDQDHSCTLYRVANEEEGKPIKLNQDEVVISEKAAYGISFVDMEVDFENRKVLVQPTINIILGFNRPLIPKKAIISEENPNFNFLINQLNRKILVFEKVCISSDNEVVYAKMFESTEKTGLKSKTKH